MAESLYMRSPLDRKKLLSNVDQFLRSRFVYADEMIETLQTPEYMLSGLEMSGRLIGDCDDISTLHAALLTAMDFKVRFVAIRSNDNALDYDHVYIEVNDGNDWIVYDVTIPLGTEINYFRRLAIQV